MKKLILGVFATTAIIISYNCKKITVPDPSNIKLNLPAQPFRYSTAQDAQGTSAVYYENGTVINDYKATIGRVLFYDKALSLNNSVSCASCHLQTNGFSDVVPFSKGFEEKLTTRNSMTIINLKEESDHGIGYFWDGREQRIEEMVFAPIANHVEMGFDRLNLIAEKIGKLDYYKPLFKACYGDEHVTQERMREDLGHFLFSIVSRKTRFDYGVLNNFSNFTPSEMSGKNLFLDHNCHRCHLLSDGFPSGYYMSGYANTGLDKEDKDPGRFGSYKIPRLRNVSRTAPYMHDGRFRTLEEVLDFYSNDVKANPNLSSFMYDPNTGGPIRMRFTDENKKDLIAFLKTLDDNTLVVDPKFSSPFIQ